MRSCHVLRVFTRGEAGGNHLGVINDCRDLDTGAMQAIAHDLGFSETTFVTWDPGEVPHVRIFTPEMELPFAGHPLVGTAWVMNMLGPTPTRALRCGVGEVSITVDGETVWVEAALNQPVRDSAESSIPARAGLPEPSSAKTVEMPLEYLILEYPDEETVHTLAPDFEVLGELFGTLTYTRSGERVRARFFAPDAGVPEDPATGSAAVALAARLAASGEPDGRITIYQGEETGFPSTIELAWSGDTVRFGGTVVRDELRVID